jgi:hypothetical protein
MSHETSRSSSVADPNELELLALKQKPSLDTRALGIVRVDQDPGVRVNDRSRVPPI